MTRFIEPFDVVDENDRVVGVQERSVVHKEGLLHRAIHVFVFNDAGHIYLQRRSMNKDTAPGKWVSSCSGHVDSGEDYDVAAIRELGEEIGLHDPESFERVFKETPCRATGNEFVWVYRCSSEGPFILNPVEVIEGKWVGMQDLDQWIEERPRDFSWSFVHLWALYKKI
ncbi:MAG: NUDIX domain-containing protein [Verrucomicrobiota bacterium]